MNKKEAEDLIVFFKKTTQGTMKINHISKNEEDKKFLKNAMMGRRGLKSKLDGKDLVLNMGYSHPVKIFTPDQLSVKVESPTTVVVTGIEKDIVGEFAAKIRSVRPPEPYKGKGIASEGEFIRRKAGKTGK